MVNLPKYVKPQTNRVGRVYYYYERFRNTPAALPRLLLPFDPQTSEFWVRAKQCERLAATRLDDKNWKWWWQPPSGRTYDLPDPKMSIADFWTAIDRAEKLEHSRLAGTNKTFSALIELYRENTAFTKLSASSKIDYERYLRIIGEAWGDDPVRNLTTIMAQLAIDEYQEAPVSGRYFRSVLSKLVAFGIPRGFSETNTIEWTEKPSHESIPYKPWPDWAFDIFFQHVRPALHLSVFSGIYTGQRKIDVVNMMRPKSDADSIDVYARKTKKTVQVTIHSEYRAILNKLQGNNVRLHVREDGEAWTYEGFKTAWQRELSFEAQPDDPPELQEKASAMKRLRDEKIVFHGLRKNAVNMLLEVGCSEAEVGAVVEMSEQMVRHYARDVNRRRLAANAMLKLESQWPAVRRGLFGENS